LASFFGLLSRIFDNSGRDLFTVRLGVSLILAKFGITGLLAEVIGLPFRGIVGLMIQDGIFLIDVSLDAIKEGQKIPEFEKLATEAWVKATARVYTEGEKDAIRKQYLDLLSGIGAVGLQHASEASPGPQR